MKTTPLSLGNIILLKEKGGMREFPGRLIRSLGVPEERGVWNSQRRGKDKLFKLFFSTFLSLSHIKRLFIYLFFPLSLELMITQQTTQFKLCTRDYITTMYPA